MLNMIATYCTSVLIDNAIIKEEKRSVLVYGFQLFISTASSLFSILLVSLITGNIVYGSIYLIVFMLLRITANGYHASTFGGCFLLTNSLFLLYLAIINIFPNVIPLSVDIFFLAFCFIYIWRKAPIEHSNHKLSLKNKKKNQFAARIIICVDIIVIATLYSTYYYKVAYAISISIFIVVAMMMVKSKESQITIT